MTALYDDMTLARPVRTRVLRLLVVSASVFGVAIRTVECMCKARLKLEGRLRSLTLSECGRDVGL